MTRVRRFDRGELAAPEKLPTGFLRVEGRIARTGIQVYVDAAGKTHRELRLPEEVFAPESLRSFAMMPVTNDHPPELLHPGTVRAHAVGSLGENIRPDGEWVVAPLTVHDAEGIAAVNAGRSQLSNGYTCTLDDTQDPALVAKWGPYEFIQRGIVGNHVALVDAARAGPEARIRLDSTSAAAVALTTTAGGATGADTQQVASVNAPVIASAASNQEITVPKAIRVDSVPMDLTESNAEVIQAAIDRALAAGTAQVADLKAKLDAATKARTVVLDNGRALVKRVATLKARIDAMKAHMASCDECEGSGQIAQDDGKTGPCDYCDGKGSFRMHEKLATADEDGGEADLPEDAEELDADELETEQETEQEAGAAHKDSKRERVRADAAKARKTAAEKARTDRAASLQRRTDREVRARLALITEAQRHLGAAEDLVKLDADAIRRKVIAKLAPTAKIDGKTTEQVSARFDAEIERVSGEQRETARDAGRTLDGGDVTRDDANLSPRQAMLGNLARNGAPAA